MTPAEDLPHASSYRSLERTGWRDGVAQPGKRNVPVETAVALVHDAATTAVMMATPADLEDFALGFSLTQGVIRSPEQIRAIERVDTDLGIEMRMWLAQDAGIALARQRRMIAGPTGCGLCGVDSLEEAARLPAAVTAELQLTPGDIHRAMDALAEGQALGALTRAVHAAGYWSPAEGMLALREDVGRHNALDKVAGALARRGLATPVGAVVLTSRVSVEMVQKTAAIGAPILVAVSAPTTLAIRAAETVGVTLVAIARDDGFEVFTHPERIRG
jgi:FdhD protein